MCCCSLCFVEMKIKVTIGQCVDQFDTARVYLTAQRNRICLQFHLTQSTEEHTRRQALTHFISQQRVGLEGCSVSLI